MPIAPSSTAPIDVSLLDPYDAQALRDRDRARVNRRWWVIFWTAVLPLAIYTYEVLELARTVRIETGGLANELTAGLAAAAGVAAFAILRGVRARWPAAVALAGAVAAWVPIARVSGDHRLALRPVDIIVLGALTVLLVASALALVRPPPPPLVTCPTPLDVAPRS